MIDHEIAQLALRAQLRSASGLPSKLVLENERYTPTAGTDYLEEQYIPATSTVTTFPATTGTLEITGLYLVRIYSDAGQGNAAIRAIVSAIMGVLPSGWSQSLSNGDLLRVRTDVGPSPGQILPLDNGFAVCTITIPFRVTSTNQAAA